MPIMYGNHLFEDREEASRLRSTSSSAFFSANQTPFFTPPTYQLSEMQPKFNVSEIYENVSSSTDISNSIVSSYDQRSVFPHDLIKPKMLENSYGSAFLSTNRIRSCDVYIGLHGRKRPLLRFASWLRSELELQGVSCFVSDRAQCRNARKRAIVDKTMDVSTFGVVILTKKSFKNPYIIEELNFFLGKKNLVPIFFDLGPGDCFVRDIIEKRGEIWEKNGGELWVNYGILEKDWKDAVNGLARVDEYKIDAQDGNWRDCIFKAVSILAMKLGRKCIVERLTKWKENVEKDEFPFPRNENFVGRKKELSELEMMIFGDLRGESEKDYFDLKARSNQKNVTLSSSRKGKEPMIWKESEKDIEMQSTGSYRLKSESATKCRQKRRSSKILYGKGIACVSGVSGIGKTELLLEFAYRFHQRYKTVLWIGGESRYIRQNYLNLWKFLEIDVGISENPIEKSRTKSFEEQEEDAISRIKKELMRNIPFLVIIDNLESEKDWWDHKHVMDLLPRFGGETHVIISTCLPRILNLEPLKISYLSSSEAMSLMQGGVKEHACEEIDVLRVIEEKLGRLTFGLAIVGAILSELPINPSRLLDTINRMPLRDFSLDEASLRRNTFLIQVFEVCFSIFDHANGPKCLATRMVQTAGWFAPSAIPVSLLGLAGRKTPARTKRFGLWKKMLRSLTCGSASSYSKKSESEASNLLLRFNLAKNSTKPGHICFNEITMIYARKRAGTRVSQAVVQAILKCGPRVSQHSDHLWAVCFLVFGFRNSPLAVELKVPDLLMFVKEIVLPLAVRTFLTFSRCGSALDLLRLCTDALEASDQKFLKPVAKSVCWRPIHNHAQLNPFLWQELALTRATVLETRAKLMCRGGQFDIADDLIRKAIFIRSSISGDNHPDTVVAREFLRKVTKLLGNIHSHTAHSR